jgi:hypothetical protein
MAAHARTCSRGRRSGLANGSYTYSVSLTLTDGGTASATRHFTIAVDRHVYWTNFSGGSIGGADRARRRSRSFVDVPA